jgi:hypothetical protein
VRFDRSFRSVLSESVENPRVKAVVARPFRDIGETRQHGLIQIDRDEFNTEVVQAINDPAISQNPVNRVVLVWVLSCHFGKNPSRLAQSQGFLELRDAISRIAVHVRSKKTQHLPTFRLELVRLSCVMDALAEAGMKFQTISVNQNAFGREVGEVGARQQPATRIIDLVLLLRLRQASRTDRPEKA